MKTAFIAFAAFTIAAMCGAAQPPLRIDTIMPIASDLGGSWTSNHVVVLVDSLSSPSEVSNESEGWLPVARGVVGKSGCSSYGVVRYYWKGQGSFLVWSRRYETKEQIGDDWGKDYDGLGKEVPPKAPAPTLPKVGEEVRFYQRHGMHNNIAFKRGGYIFDVEGQDLPHLKELAEAIDRNLTKLEAARTNAEAKPTQKK